MSPPASPALSTKKLLLAVLLPLLLAFLCLCSLLLGAYLRRRRQRAREALAASVGQGAGALSRRDSLIAQLGEKWELDRTLYTQPASTGYAPPTNDGLWQMWDG